MVAGVLPRGAPPRLGRPARSVPAARRPDDPALARRGQADRERPRVPVSPRRWQLPRLVLSRGEGLPRRPPDAVRAGAAGVPDGVPAAGSRRGPTPATGAKTGRHIDRV